MPPPSQPAPCPGLIGWLLGHVRMLVLLAMAGLGITGGLVYFGVLGIDQLDAEIRARVLAKFRAHYPQLTIEIDSAHLLKGRGIQVRGVTIRDPHAPPRAAEMVYIDEVLAECNTNLQELLTHEPHITAFTVRRPKLSVTRREDGLWNAQAMLPLPKSNKPSVPITIEDARVEICDPACNAGRPLVLKNLDLVIAPDHSPEALTVLPEAVGRTPLRITGKLACEHFRSLSIDGWLDPVGGKWAFSGDVANMQVSPALESSLPIDIPTRVLSLHDLHGKLSLNYEITNQGLAQADALAPLPFRFAIAGALEEGRLEDPKLPHPLTELSAKFFCGDHGARLESVTARCGAAKLSMSIERAGWSNDAPLRLAGRVTQLALDTSLADVLDDQQREAWDRFLPSGAINADFNLAFDGRAWHKEITAELLNVSVAFDKFPYRVTNAVGSVKLKDHELTCDATALGGNRQVTCQAHIFNPGPDFTGWVDLQGAGLVSIDERLLLAIEEKTQKIVRALDPRGEISFHFRLDRPDARFPPEPNLVVGLHDCKIQYAKFPYPLDGVRGLIRWDHGNWTFEQLSGVNDGAAITAAGSLVRDDAGALRLHFEFNVADLPLEDDLKRALPEKMQTLWSNFKPSGSLDHVQAIVDYHCEQKQLSLEIVGSKYVQPKLADTRGITIEAASLPYRLDQVTGAFRYHNGDLTLSGIKAQHGKAKLALDAFCQLPPDGGWSVELKRLLIDRLEVDRELLTALPTTVSDLLSKSELAGPLHISGNATVLSQGQTAQPTSATWDLSLDLENGSLTAGMPLTHIHGGVRLVGGADERGFACNGELEVDSVMVSGVQLTQVIGPLSVDGSRMLFGAWAQQANPQQLPRQITAKVFNGSVAGDAQVLFDTEQNFEVQAALTGADLASIAADKAPQRKELSGKAEGFVRLLGTRQGRHTWNGGGAIRLRDADIYEVPVMVSLLKLLSIRPPDKTAFTTADLDYRIQGEHIYLDRLDFHGDAITLKGTGEMDWQRHINLQFYTMVGRDEVQVPILRPLLGEASRQLMLIQVGGTLDAPEPTRQAFPGLNETLQQIFPEAKLR